MSPKPVLFRRFRFFGIEIDVRCLYPLDCDFDPDSDFDFDDSNMPGCCFSNP